MAQAPVVVMELTLDPALLPRAAQSVAALVALSPVSFALADAESGPGWSLERLARVLAHWSLGVCAAERDECEKAW